MIGEGRPADVLAIYAYLLAKPRLASLPRRPFLANSALGMPVSLPMMLLFREGAGVAFVTRYED